MLPGDFFLVRLHPRDFRKMALFEDEGYEVRDRITHYNRDFTEDFWVLRSPPERNVVNNVLKHGCGALNIDGCRVATSDDLNGGAYSKNRKPRAMNPHGEGERQTTVEADYKQPTGRWPAHVVLSHNEDCGDHCTKGCVVDLLDKQSGHLHDRGNKKAHVRGGGLYGHGTFKSEFRSYDNGGGASRYFFSGKPSEVYSWLARLLSRPR